MTALRELKPPAHAPAAQPSTVVLVTDHIVPSQAKSGYVLSRREREILGLLANGMNGAAIARQLSISSETVRTHVRNAMRKLAARTRVHAVTLALRRHEISLN
jgi:DNA-binding CsgD family transcriptional regulator